MSGEATLSIIIPVKDRAELIQETLRSVQGQTYPQWEAVVVDDQSTDETRKVVAAMAGDDERIRLLRRSGEKGGAPVCRNIGWRSARGEYVVFLDSDDLLAEGCLEQRVRYMEAHPGLDFAVFGACFFDEVPGDKNELFNVPTDENPLDRFLMLDLPWQTTGPIYRRSAVKQIGEWNKGLSCGQDVDYGVRSLCHDLRYHHTDSFDYYMRTGASGREKAGGDPWSPERLPMRRKRVEATHRVLAETGNLTEKRKLRIVGNFLHLAECWAERGKIDRARATWRICCRTLDVASERVCWFVDRYLKHHSTLWARYMAYYMCRRFPSELFVSGFSVGRRSSEEAKTPEEFPLQDYRSPYRRHAFILINGPVGYTIRRIFSSMNLTSSARSVKKMLRL
jgi:glycosyltransferase involved in cell wall biosynthesis